MEKSKVGTVEQTLQIEETEHFSDTERQDDWRTKSVRVRIMWGDRLRMTSHQIFCKYYQYILDILK